MKLLKLICMLMMQVSLAAGVATDVVESAARDNQHVFLFFYRDQSDKSIRVERMFDRVSRDIGKEIKAVKVNVTDAVNQGLVDRFALKRAPMPFVIALAPNGAITGGFNVSVTEEQLKGALSSPGMASCLKALQERKMVLLCLQNNQTSQNEAALLGVREFQRDPRFQRATEVVVMDPTESKERAFLSQLGVDSNSSQASTVVIAPPAEIIGRYQGATTKAQIIADVQKASSGGCCPGGCCPGGCCGGNNPR